MTRLRLAAFSLAALVVALDQLSKYWVLEIHDLPARISTPVLPFFSLTMVWNTGFSFGLGGDSGQLGRWLITAFSLAVASVLAVWAWRATRPLTATALGLIIGGAIGNNLIDRVRFGAVADFLDFRGLYFPWIFNVADAAITIGVVALLADSLLTPDPAKTPKATPPTA